MHKCMIAPQQRQPVKGRGSMLPCSHQRTNPPTRDSAARPHLAYLARRLDGIPLLCNGGQPLLQVLEGLPILPHLNRRGYKGQGSAGSMLQCGWTQRCGHAHTLWPGWAPGAVQGRGGCANMAGPARAACPARTSCTSMPLRLTARQPSRGAACCSRCSAACRSCLAYPVTSRSITDRTSVSRCAHCSLQCSRPGRGGTLSMHACRQAGVHGEGLGAGGRCGCNECSRTPPSCIRPAGQASCPPPPPKLTWCPSAPAPPAPGCSAPLPSPLAPWPASTAAAGSPPWHGGGRGLAVQDHRAITWVK